MTPEEDLSRIFALSRAMMGPIEAREKRFPRLPLPFHGDVSLGNGTMWKFYMAALPNERLFVGVEGKGCYTFDDFVHVTYVMEKLGIINACDAGNVADAINDQLTLQPEYAKIRQGRYGRVPF